MKGSGEKLSWKSDFAKIGTENRMKLRGYFVRYICKVHHCSVHLSECRRRSVWVDFTSAHIFSNWNLFSICISLTIFVLSSLRALSFMLSSFSMDYKSSFNFSALNLIGLNLRTLFTQIMLNLFISLFQQLHLLV